MINLQSKSAKKYKLILTITTFTLTLTLITACTNNNDNQSTNTEESQTELITPVTVEPAQIGALNINQTFYGKVTPEETTPILPMQAGEINELNIENGSRVEEGDVLARINPGNSPIEAPHNGTIDQLTVKEGSLVTNTNPIGTIIQTDTLKIIFHVTAEQLHLFKIDNQITTTINNKKKQATVSYISITPDETGLYIIETTFENKHDYQSIKPGMIAQAEITEKKVENELIIPTEAIFEENDKTYIYTIKENEAQTIAEKHQIEILNTQTEKSAIKPINTEIPNKAQVITQGQLTLTNGSKVEVMKEEQ